MIYAPLDAMQRVALKDFTFSDGTTIPAGQSVAMPGYALHHDGVSVSLALFLGQLSIHFLFVDHI
jgi:hypothetical protein